MTRGSRKWAVWLVVAAGILLAFVRLARRADLLPFPAAHAAHRAGAARMPDAPARPARAEVVHVYDGDTLRVRVGGVEERVRLIGVDTPEGRPEGRPPEPFADRARELTRQLALGGSVTLEPDPLVDDRDRFGRLLRYVFLPDRRLLNGELLRAGLGFAYTRFPFSRREEFEDLERRARAAGSGAWAPGAVPVVTPRDAPEHLGAVVAVEGRIVRAERHGGICFLDFDEDRRRLSGVIFERDRHRFGDDPAELYRGSEVRLVGRVTRHRGRPQIEVRGPDQVRILEPAGR